MPRSSFDFNRGVTQWRMEPLTGDPYAGEFAFTLGYDGLVPRYEDVAYGDYFQTTQSITTTNVALIRCHVNIQQPFSLPDFEDVSQDFQLIEESVDSPGNRVVIARGVSEADINRTLVVTGATNAANNQSFKVVGICDSVTVFVDRAVVTEGPRSTISATLLGARWKFSILIDNVEYVKCIQSDREAGFYRDDLMAHVSKLTGAHNISFRITLVEHDPTNLYNIAPPLEGMIFWVKGDADLLPTSGDFVSWADQGGQAQDLNLTGVNPPQTGVDTIDGVPALTFPAADDGAYAARASAMKDRNGNTLAQGTARTIMAVFRPTLHSTVTRIGGPVFATADQPNFECLFQIENWFTFNDAWFIFDNIWSFSGYQRLAPVTAVATWEDVNVLGEWRSSGGSVGLAIAFAVNGGADQPLTDAGAIPTTVQAGITGGAAGNTFAVGNCWNNSGNVIAANFHGCIAEIIMWDYDLSTNVSARNKAIAYFANKYPSIDI
jgi:hypothetical protein